MQPNDTSMNPSTPPPLVFPKRPIRVNGKLSLPREIWEMIFQEMLTNEGRILFCHGSFSRFRGLSARRLEFLVDRLLQPFQSDMQVGLVWKSEAEEYLWKNHDVVFPINVDDGPIVIVREWNKRIIALAPSVRSLHLLIRDGEYSGFQHSLLWHLPWLTSGPISRAARWVDPILESCPRLDRLTVQLVYSHSARGEAAIAQLDGHNLLARVKLMLAKLKTVRQQRNIEVILSVAPAECLRPQAAQSHVIALADYEINQEADLALQGGEDVASLLVNTCYGRGAGNVARRVAVRLT